MPFGRSALLTMRGAPCRQVGVRASALPHAPHIAAHRPPLAGGCDTRAVIASLVERFYAVLWNMWDDSAVEEVLAPDFHFRGSLGQTVEGRDGWRTYRDMIRDGSADFHNEVTDLVVSGERAAARLKYTGTHTGPLLGLDPTGRRFVYSGAAFFTASGGVLAEAWVLGDVESLRVQLS